MNQRKYFVLRQLYEEPIRTELYKEIKLGRYRQGWGIKSLDLRQGKEDWIKNLVEWSKDWEEEITPSKAENTYWILYTMLEIKQGDIILVPKQPNNETFVLAQATVRGGEVYDFDNEDESKRKLLGDDFRHIINIEPESLREVPYDANITSSLVKKKIRGYQKAVNNVWDEELKQAISILLQAPVAKPLPVADILTEAISPIYMQVLEHLRRLSPNKLEELIEMLFFEAELTVTGRNIFDRVGGDIDRIFELPINLPPLVEMLSPDIAPPIKFNVQIKQKSGIDFDDKKGVEQLIKMSSGATNENNVLISTADDFTEGCKSLAKEGKVILINWKKLAELVMKNL